MGIVISNIRELEKDLIDRGYRRRPYRRGYMGVKLLVKDNKGVLTVPSIEIDTALGQTISAAVDEYFKKLKLLIERMKNSTITDIVFAGGGTVQIPDWFLDWCKQQGINVHISSPAEPIRSGNIGA